MNTLSEGWISITSKYNDIGATQKELKKTEKIKENSFLFLHNF